MPADQSLCQSPLILTLPITSGRIAFESNFIVFLAMDGISYFLYLVDIVMNFFTGPSQAPSAMRPTAIQQNKHRIPSALVLPLTCMLTPRAGYMEVNGTMQTAPHLVAWHYFNGSFMTDLIGLSGFMDMFVVIDTTRNKLLALWHGIPMLNVRPPHPTDCMCRCVPFCVACQPSIMARLHQGPPLLIVHLLLLSH
jgi:hypothetical protein